MLSTYSTHVNFITTCAYEMDESSTTVEATEHLYNQSLVLRQ